MREDNLQGNEGVKMSNSNCSESIIFSLYNPDTKACTYRVIARDEEIIEQIIVQDGEMAIQNILTINQAIVLAKSILVWNEKKSSAVKG